MIAKTFATTMLCCVAVAVFGVDSRAQNVLQINVLDNKGEHPIGTSNASLCPVRVAMRVSPTFYVVPGYQNIQFLVRPAIGKTFPSDGRVTVRFHSSTYDQGSGRTAILEVPVRAGETLAESSMLTPCEQGYGTFSVDCGWNGTYFRHLSVGFGYVSASPGSADSSPLRLRLASPDSVSRLASETKTAFENITDSEMPFALTLNEWTAVASSFNNRWIEYIGNIEHLPKSWLHWAVFDRIVISFDDLQKLDESGRRMLNQYLWCGGSVHVLDIQTPSALEGILATSWDRKVVDPELDASIHSAGFGSVLLQWNDNEDLRNPVHRSRSRRLYGTMGQDYWTWLIPEVGKTPIWSFLGMVVLVVGLGAPAILFWSQRIQRRVWTLLAIPCLSIASVLSLFVYASLKDGWDSKTRIRSITTLDSDGNGAVWSRQTYFAGSNPGGRVRLDANTECIPLRFRGSIEMTQYQDDAQQIYSGMLPLRQQRQFSIAHPVSSVAFLQTTGQSAAQTGLPQTRNISSFRIAALVACDASGQTYRAENIAPGAGISWQQVDKADAIPWLQELCDVQKLRAPDDAPATNSYSMFDFFGSARFNSYGFTSDFLLEESYRELELTTWGIETPFKFVALSDQAPQLDKSLPNAAETNSLHLVIGRLRPAGQ